MRGTAKTKIPTTSTRDTTTCAIRIQRRRRAALGVAVAGSGTSLIAGSTLPGPSLLARLPPVPHSPPFAVTLPWMSVTAARPSVGFRRRPLDLAWLGGGLLVLVASAVVASDGGVGPREEALFHAINGLPDWLELPMTSLQFLGVLVVGPIVAVAGLPPPRPPPAPAAFS